VEPVDRLGAGRDQLVAAVGEQLQRHQSVIGGHREDPFGVQRRQSDRVRVCRVGLAPVAGGEHPDPGRQLGRHIHHGLPVGN